jgi:hypothetical protein
MDQLVTMKLWALLDHLMYITRPDGTTPFIGDDDGGRLVTLDQRPANDFRAALSNGASLFRRSDYKFVAGEIAEETLWLLGPDGVDKFESIPAHPPSNSSVAFRESGYFVMRDGWAKDSNYLLIDCGPHGAVSGGHAHADALSLEVVANGQKILVDPGTFTYTGSAEKRDWFRSSSAHNCLTINGESSSVPGGPFSWEQIASCSQQDWISNKYFDFFKGQHDGYLRVNPDFSHVRSVLFLKNEYCIIRDQVEATGSKVDLWFHFAPEWLPVIGAGCDPEARTAIVEEQLVLTIFGGGTDIISEKGWVSYCYGSKQEATVCRYSTSVEGTTDVFTFLLPIKRGVAPPSVYQMAAIDGYAFRVEFAHWTDIVLIAGRKQVQLESYELSSDFQWSLLRFESNELIVPIEMKLLNGRKLRASKFEIVNSHPTSKALVAMRSDTGFRVENLNSLS